MQWPTDAPMFGLRQGWDGVFDKKTLGIFLVFEDLLKGLKPMKGLAYGESYG